MRTHLLLFVMCVVSSILGSAFTMSIQHVQAQSGEEGPRVVTASEFRLVDEQGELRANLTLESVGGLEEPCFNLLEPSTGYGLAKFGIGADGLPYMLLNHRDYKSTRYIQRGTSDPRRPSSVPIDPRQQRVDR